MNKLISFLVLSFVLTLLAGCNKDQVQVTKKFFDNDPFDNTIVESQTFKINSQKDTVIEGKEGTVLSFPKGCFVSLDGNAVNGKIELELAEALTMEKMLLSNLTTTSNQKLLETDGMIYFNATSKGKQLRINPKKPVYIEIPTPNKKANMSVYKGIRDENGNMNWINPKKLENWLIPVDIHLLNFLPEGFETEVEKGMPFRNYTHSSKELIDSLYYSLSLEEIVPEEVPTESEYNESNSYGNKDEIDSLLANVTALDTLWGTHARCGVNPSIIKAIKSEKFQNTLIATREFENRLKYMFKICRPDIIDIYIKNLDKNLWELDSITAEVLNGDKYTDTFKDFSKEKLTNVKAFNKNIQLLRKFYEQRLKQVQSELIDNREKAIAKRKEKDKAYKKILDEYKQVLRKREKYRMETYGFEWTETGWVNIDRGTLEKDWEEQQLEFLVENGKGFDQIYSYVIYSSIKSLYKLNSSDNETFYVGNETLRSMPIPKKQKAVAIAIGYHKGQSFFASKEFETTTESKIFLTLKTLSLDDINRVINAYDRNYGEENKIEKDLEFMSQVNEFKKEQEKFNTELEFMSRLTVKAFPCYNSWAFDEEYQIDLWVCDPKLNIEWGEIKETTVEQN